MQGLFPGSRENLATTCIMTKKSTSSKKIHVWTPKQLSLLGTISDGKLARRLGIQTAAVFLKRSMMGIAPSRPISPVKWTPKNLALLGKYPDAEVARMLKTYRKSVIEKRRSLGIQCYAKTSKFWHTWTEQEVAMLGKKSDSDLSKELGISAMCVTSKRRLLEIPSFSGRKSTNRPRRSLSDWKPQEIALLGTMNDGEVAERLDLSPGTVRLKRLSLGISAFGGHRRSARVWTPDVIARLGKEPAAVIAQDLGISSARVHQKRNQLGILPVSARQGQA